MDGSLDVAMALCSRPGSSISWIFVNCKSGINEKIRNFFVKFFLDGETPCDTAWMTMRCYFDLDPENTQLI